MHRSDEYYQVTGDPDLDIQDGKTRIHAQIGWQSAESDPELPPKAIPASNIRFLS
ncbi:unnamed protein product [Anisakis simplex]|uniref:Lipoprotein n=1 Tax=Anisakis simplex TaxID=6269 RepID=A0A0M3JC18_ANISI|nr:unnamed protein product [Anisakis simplex]